MKKNIKQGLAKVSKNDVLDDILKEYIENAIKHGENTLSGDDKNANKAFDKLEKLYLKIKDLESPTFEKFSQLLNHDNLSVITFVASKLLNTQLKDNAITTLQKVVNLDEPIFSFSAEMILEEWKKRNKKEKKF